MVEFVDDNYRFADNEHAQMETMVDDAEIVVEIELHFQTFDMAMLAYEQFSKE